jgi:hypothetical protein
MQSVRVDGCYSLMCLFEIGDMQYKRDGVFGCVLFRVNRGFCGLLRPLWFVIKVDFAT